MDDKKQKILHDFKKIATLIKIISKDLSQEKKIDTLLLEQHLEKLYQDIELEFNEKR